MLAATAAQHAEAEERRLRQLWRDKQNELAQVRQQLTVLEKLQRESETRLAAVTAQRSRADEELTNAQARHVEIEAHIVTMSDGEDLEPLLKTAQAEAEHARREVAESRVRLGSLERDKQIRAERIRHANAEIARWHGRQASAEAQVQSLDARLKEARDEMAATADLPARIAAQRETLLSALSRAEDERRTAADNLASAENAIRAATESLRADSSRGVGGAGGQCPHRDAPRKCAPAAPGSGTAYSLKPSTSRRKRVLHSRHFPKRLPFPRLPTSKGI